MSSATRPIDPTCEYEGCTADPTSSCQCCDAQICDQHTLRTIDGVEYQEGHDPATVAVEAANRALNAYNDTFRGENDADTVTDLVTALMHWCEHNGLGLGLGESLSTAYLHYHFERNPRRVSEDHPDG